MSQSPHPNLLYIHSDQHSPYVAGCYGDPLVETPHLDALAERGVVFDNTYCPSPICVPSRMSMLSGRYPCDNQVWTNSHILDSGIPTFAHAMGAGGYHPVLIGRMHSVGPDQLHGYAERLVGDHGPNQPGGKGVDHGQLSGTAGPGRISLRLSGHGQSAYQVHDEDVTAATVDYLNRLGVAKRAGQVAEPFSLSVGFMLPHQPFVARLQDYRYYYENITPPQTPEPFGDHLHPHIKHWRQACEIEEVSEEETRRARAAYWALVHRMDALIGQIIAALRENDLEENTLILYTSDHGEQVGEHGLWWKQTFYEDSVKVPTILAWPGRLPAGTRCDRVISSLDLNATMLDALGCPALPHSRGRSLLPLLADPQNAEWDDVVFSEFCQDAAGAGGPFSEVGIFQRMIRRGPWKLNYYHGQPCQLFDLQADPRERCDLAADPAHQETLAALKTEVLDGWDPEWIAARMAALRADRSILAMWGRTVQPPDQCRWKLDPAMDYLDSEQLDDSQRNTNK
ncbi:MAG: sulfatase-like hydrolase/transferase [Gemmatimonadetes bacterium]|nr:sulfatase-like hydrolase/transferase [Gemmatimonadota bacterium]